ncbi:DddA-like double-stranded DNA deaminase toxin [Actinokineospora sp. NPDC004072]
MSLVEVAAAMREGLGRIDAGKASLTAAAALFDEARALVQHSTRGTQRSEAGQAVAAQSEALRRIGEVLAQVDAAGQAMAEYLADITAPTTSTGTPPRRPPAGPRPRPSALATGRVERLRSELPPPLDGPGTGRKTHGRWFIDDHPAQTIVSGEDDTADLAARYLARLGSRVPVIRTHAEAKLAALIRQHWETTGEEPQVTLVINHEVCPGRMSCRTYLPRLLPPGCSITVVTPRTRHTFTGDPT